ncbi:helix-turn-helix domain-containing protein [Streptomyces sp. QL37]|uniref:helix-turn-helix domain-containing protein n=1 Tax=Streptomyces sp. QL37 TaxID=2093747 RepID=UPI001374CD90|nr:helix-turn-helix transcriptional regulator [Streptomyces sp. QL37]
MANPSTGRPEKPVSGDYPNTVAVALILREQRHISGLTLRQLSHRVNYSVATLSAAASGKSLHRWEVVKAYAKGCNASPQLMTDLWERWQLASSDLNGTNSAPPTPRDSPEQTHSPQPPNGDPQDTKLRSQKRARTATNAAQKISAGNQPQAPLPRRSKGAPAQSFADTVGPEREVPFQDPTTTQRQRNAPSDPGNSLTALMRQARAMESSASTAPANPFATALTLCTTSDHFSELTRRLWQHSGLSLRDLSYQTRKTVYPISKSTFHAALNSNQLPPTEVLHALLVACAVPSDNWSLWHHTRTRLKLAQLVTPQEEHMSKIMMLRTDPVLRAAIVYIAVIVIAVFQVIFLVTAMFD